MAAARSRMPSFIGGVVLIIVLLATGLSAEQKIKADRVVVKKGARLLLLMHQEKVLFTFPIALGGVPEGDKL